MYKQIAPAEVSQYVHNTIWGEYHDKVLEMVAIAARRKVPTRELSLALSSYGFGAPQVQDELKSLVGHCYQFAVEKELFMRFDPSRLTDDGVYHGYNESTSPEEALAAVRANIAQSPGGFFLYLRERVVIPKLSDMRRCRASAQRGDLAVLKQEDGKVIQGSLETINDTLDLKVSAKTKKAPISALEEIPDCDQAEARAKIAVLKSKGLQEELEFLQLEKHLDIQEQEYNRARELNDSKTMYGISAKRSKAKEEVKARLLAALKAVEELEESMAY